jgi:hypothetical protein
VFWQLCPGSNVMVVLFWLHCLVGPVPHVIFCLFRCAYPILTVLF